MAMNFFEDQERARGETRKLIFLYSLTVLITCLGTGVFFTLVFYYEGRFEAGWAFQEFIQSTLGLKVLFGATVVSFVAVLGTSLFKMMMLGQPGKYVAMCAGASSVDKTSNDPDIKRYVNVVEEMSIASGTPMPAIYIMEDDLSINAFAAGYEINDAAIAVTKGCIKTLSRDELQGVIAHEFSHIFNGDMRLNIRLIGFLAGLTTVFNIGRQLLRSQRYVSRSRKKGGGVGIFGLGLMAIGGMGMFLAALLKAAISRQREFLADASSVQYTRNPDGIGGALKKIAAGTYGSFIGASRAGEVAHMFFADPIGKSFISFDTHPPLAHRLKAVYPNFNYRHFKEHEVEQIIKKMQQEEAERIEDEDQRRTQLKKDALKKRHKWLEGVGPVIVGYEAAKRLGKVKVSEESANEIQKNLSWASDKLDHTNTDIRRAVRDPVQAKALVFALLIERADSKKKHLDFIASTFGDVVGQRVEALLEALEAEEQLERIEILSLLVGTIKGLGEVECKDFLQEVVKYVNWDNRITTSEFIFYSFLKSALVPPNFTSGQRLKKSAIRDDIRTLFSYLVHVGHKDDSMSEQAFAHGITKLYASKVSILPKSELKYGRLEKAFRRIRKASPTTKEMIVNAAIEMANFDGTKSSREKEIIRLFCQAIGVPFPGH